MQLNNFNGGLNLKLAPHLIAKEEGVIYSNIDNAPMSLSPINQDTNISVAGGNSIVYFNNMWIANSQVRDYVEFQNKLYYSNGIDRPQKSSNGTTWYNVGIDKPSTQITTISVATPGNLTGTYQWCYTYYNSVDGTESMPNTFSPEVVITAGKATFDVVASTDQQVTNIRLYRLGGNLLYMTMVVELTNTNQTYLDNIADIDVTSTSLSSENNGVPQSGLQFLSEFNTMIFGAKGAILYFTDIAYPNYWGPFNFIEFEADITAIGVTVNGLLVFTASRTYTITGTEPGGLTRYLLSSYQGCKSHRSIQFLNGGCLFVSNDGVCVSDGAQIKVISNLKFNKLELNVIDSAIYNDEYYLMLDTSTFIVDFKSGNPIFKNIDIIGQCIYYSHTLDNLYYSKSNAIYSCFTSSSKRSLHYKSGKISEGSLTNRKNYNNVYIYATGAMQCKIYIDSVLLHTYSLVAGVNDITVPLNSRYGYYMELEFTGTNEILEVEYKVEGRQNGR